MLMECPRLRELRVELRRKAGDALRSVSSLLGGSNEGEKGNPDIVSRAKTVYCRPYWTSLRRHSSFAVVCHKGSLTMGAAMGHERP